MDAEAIKKMKALLREARGQPVNFGLCLGQKPEETAFLLHRSRTPKALQSEAKKAVGTNKFACGQVTAEERVATLRCEDGATSGLARHLRSFLKINSLQMKVIVADANGKIVDQDGDEDSAPETGAGGDGVTALAERFKLRRGQVLKLKDGPLKTKLLAALEGTLKAIKDKDVAKAEKSLDIIEKTLAQAKERAAAAKAAAAAHTPEQTPAGQSAAQDVAGAAPASGTDEPVLSPLQREWETRWAKLSPELTKVLHSDPPEATKLRAAMLMADESAAKGKFEKANTIATRLEKLLKGLANVGSRVEAGAAKPQALDLTKSRVLWSRVRSSLREEIGKLGKAIVQACDPDMFENMEEAVKGLYDYLDPIDEALEHALDALMQESDPGKRKPLLRKCQAAIGTYLSELNSGFFLDVDNDNGFVSGLKIRKSAVAALEAISRELDKEERALA